ncbi:MAG: glutamate--tRNA ligase [Bacteroidia bacterium]|nr:MAG: glutamate--tRNA ligase [Bacteroidia bacterium]
MNQNLRVRFAPSPTGPLHIGGLRTALFNYLFAKKNGGTFILRIEDTDQTRFVTGAEDYIQEALEWCGLIPDEGPRQGGGFGPYRQSERKNKYKKYALQLLGTGDAYYGFDTPEELDALRQEHESRGETFVYDARVRESLKNSLTMDKQEVDQLISSGTPYVIRFRFEPGTEIHMDDMVRGEVIVNSSTLDDKILFKSDGMPTYHLANVVDDNLMAISHVIRGEEWLPSLPLHVALYRAFGWEHLMPRFAHLPLILKPTGKGKLSKRDGEKGGFPVFPLEWHDPVSGAISPGYREEGYLPQACINLLALLGWNPGTEQEIFSLDELVDEFQLEKVGKSGSRFDPEKSLWFNHQHIQLMEESELIKAFQSVLLSSGVETTKGRIAVLVPIIKPRINFIHEIWDESWFFFHAPDAYDPEVIKKWWKEDTPQKMELLSAALEKCETLTPESVETLVKGTITENEWGMGAIMNVWRLLLVGAAKGPGLFDLAAFLGREEVIDRMAKGIKQIEDNR